MNYSPPIRHQGKIFTGVVITSNTGSGATTVIRDSYAESSSDMGAPIQGILISSVMSAYLGFKESLLPQPGCRVLCVEYTLTECYILGVIPQQSLYLPGVNNRSMLGAGDPSVDRANNQGFSDMPVVVTNAQTPSDATDGEHVISNEFGVLLGLYQQMANLKASELAQIQCYLLDDLVRVISHNFQHYTALGEYNIYHDGKMITAEFGATHKSAETYGSPAVNSDQGAGKTFTATSDEPPKEDIVDYYTFTSDERIKAIERFKIFLGGLGDFLHIFLAKPDENEKRYLAPEQSVSKPDSGLCDLHIGTDGGLHMRSVKEVFIEKTNWIRIPHRRAAPDDPNGDDAENLDYKEKKKYEFVKEFKFKNNPFNYAQQLRDYVAYVNEKLGYQNFKTHEKDFYVSNDINQETPLDNIKKIDQQTQADLQTYKLKTAGIYLMPNGGITIRDAWNSAIVMEGGNISIQPAKDLFLQPLRSLVGKIGGNISLAARKQVDLSTTEESVRIKSQKGQHFYSHESGIVIESNSEEESLGELEQEKALEKLSGVVLKSKSSVFIGADKNVVTHSKERTYLKSLKEAIFVFEEPAIFYGLKDMRFLADSQILLEAEKGLTLLTPKQAILAGAEGTALGQKDKPLSVGAEKPIKGTLKVNEELKKMELEKVKEQFKDIWKLSKFESIDKFDLIKFRFLDKTGYGSLDSKEDAIPSTLAQQDDLLTGVYELDKWEEKEINETLPYPSKKLFTDFYYKAEAPKNLTKSNTSDDYASKGEPSEKGCKVKLASLQEYSVYKTTK